MRSVPVLVCQERLTPESRRESRSRVSASGEVVELKACDRIEMLPGDVFVIETPGGGGYGPLPDPGSRPISLSTHASARPAASGHHSLSMSASAAAEP